MFGLTQVHIGLINYAESGDLLLDLNRLASSSGGLESAGHLRNLFKADLVCLITELENLGIGGEALDITPHGGDPRTGFVVVRRTSLSVLGHELGHLLGCAHDREHAGDLESDFYKKRKPYIFAHRFEVEGVTYIDEMAYKPGIMIPYVSNPRLDLDGVPLGVAADQSLPSDGARTINEVAPYVAGYRTALSRVEFEEARIVASEDDVWATVRLVRRGDLTEGTRVNVLLEPDSSAKPGRDYIRPTSTMVEFAPGQSTAELVIQLLADDVEEGEESIRMRFTTVQGDHGIGHQSTAEVVILDGSTPASFAAVEFPDGELAVPESAGAALVRIRHSGVLDAKEGTLLELPFWTVNGSAIAGQDYVAQRGSLTLVPGETEGEISIPLLHRPETGLDRTFSIVAGTRTNTVRILDEQRLGSLMGTLGPGLDSEDRLNSRIRGDGAVLVWGNFTRLGKIWARH
jgi:hypothetical protein